MAGVADEHVDPPRFPDDPLDGGGDRVVILSIQLDRAQIDGAVWRGGGSLFDLPPVWRAIEANRRVFDGKPDQRSLQGEHRKAEPAPRATSQAVEPP